MARLADTLTEAGHNVTFFMPILDEARKNQLGVKLTKDVILLEQPPSPIPKDSFTIDNITETFWHVDVNSKSGHHLFEPLHKQSVLACENIFRNQNLLEDLKSRDYDIALAEPLMSCGLALFKHLGIEKVVIASSCPNYDPVIEAMGEPADTSYVPAIFSEVSSDKMNFWERLENYEMYHFMVKTYGAMFDDEAKVFRKFLGQDFPDWHQLIPDASLHFANSIPYLDFPRPAIQKTVYMGGITVDVERIQSEKLPETWGEVLDKRPKNMFLSFGSLAKSCEMPKESKENLLEVFRSEPNVTFIWKYESEDVKFATGIPNVHFVKWAPQTALLHDPRLTAFLSHGGLGSTFEAAFLGKPAIMVPIFFDQSRNNNMLSRLGMTITLHKKELGDFKKLKHAFREILHNENYKKNSERVADVVRNQPFTPKEIVVKNIEFVGRYGPFHHMTPYSLKMPWFQRYCYDVYLYKLILYTLPVLLVLILGKAILSKLPFAIVKQSKKIE
ncbi:hypothetical protein CAEBREN_24255 [Caenorhabditis brenneri]|uniref:UDP-glucuronosyltransferase n=1 Tax=Caenorhabditis brenneri TaxID=135651 RepID=G0NFM5_CAEBE|nr:hypothetical protein CAEBREN_24255 [Caenorhabditis brenneri]